MKTNTESPAGGQTRFRNWLLLLFLAVTLAYANHFENGFHFDDAHTIVDNPAIRELTVWRFFADGSTFSSLPSNQSYRPLITLVNALDYRILDGLYPGAFHTHIFLTFLACIALLVLFVRLNIRQTGVVPLSQASKIDRIALSVGALFGLLCANAETVNYIIQRAEIESGMYLLAGFVAFLQGGVWRKWHLYMLFPVIGFFAKEMAFMFAPLLLIYLALFYEKVDLLRVYRRTEYKKLLRAIRKSLPAFAITVLCGIFYANMLPDTFSTGSSDRWAYLITQPFVIGHYVLTFFIPYNLSADTDWRTFSSLSDYRGWVGLVFVGFLIWLALRTSRHRDTRMVSFGILWFLITLLPTSSIIPLAEVLNDHRCFIPYMGLTMAVVFGVRYLLIQYFPVAIRQARTQRVLWMLFFLVLAGNAYGVHERNSVWRNDLTLWADVTKKSPGNGRGFMNYGLALMARGQYAEAEENFVQAVQLYPDYALGYVNLGILNSVTGDVGQADQYFRTALTTTTADHVAHYYYGRYLYEQGRNAEARSQLEMALARHATDPNARALLFEVLHRQEDWIALETLAAATLQMDPNNQEASGYLQVAAQKTPYEESVLARARKMQKAADSLNLSLYFFNEGKYEECIQAAREALKYDPNNPAAFNNIGIAHVRLGRFEEGIAAYRQALEMSPEFELAKNNLEDAIKLLHQSTQED